MDQKLLRVLQKYNMESGRLSISAQVAAADRFTNFSLESGGLLLDVSRTSLDTAALSALHRLVRDRGVETARTKLFSGKNLNFTEQRPALHMALRSDQVLHTLDQNSIDQIMQSQQRMFGCAAAFADGHLPGDDSQRLRDIIHIGIGGSMLGPRLLCEALGNSAMPQVHFLSSADVQPRKELLQQLNPAETAVVIASKSFTTDETRSHVDHILQWLKHSLGNTTCWQRVFAISNNLRAVAELGVPTENTFYLPTWVGGRYSIWSAVSLAAAAAMGVDNFRQFLRGAADMDVHFQTASLGQNLPVLMAQVAIWHRNICNYPAQAVIPYDHRLRSLPAYLQQLVMESNGKSVDSKGRPVGCPTAPVVFGEAGTDAQHSFFQMLHQGTDIVPLSFIGVIRSTAADSVSRNSLLANMLAQATTLASGTTGHTIQDPHRQMPGGRPSEIILLDELTPCIFGRLLAMYEHKVFVESVIWDINAFDQYGVELGKTVAKTIQPALEDPAQKLPDSYGLNALLGYIQQKQQA